MSRAIREDLITTLLVRHVIVIVAQGRSGPNVSDSIMALLFPNDKAATAITVDGNVIIAIIVQDANSIRQEMRLS